VWSKKTNKQKTNNNKKRTRHVEFSKVHRRDTCWGLYSLGYWNNSAQKYSSTYTLVEKKTSILKHKIHKHISISIQKQGER